MSAFFNNPDISHRNVADFPAGSPGYSVTESQSSNEAVLQPQESRHGSVASETSRRGFLNRLLPGRKKAAEAKTNNGKADKVQKKRGPKPDSKPAQNRRQELNRQAQRTHRERKELHVKKIEAELRTLKEEGEKELRQKKAVSARKLALEAHVKAYQTENRQLRQLLIANGVPIFHAPIVALPPSPETDMAPESSDQIISNGYSAPIDAPENYGSVPHGHNNNTINYGQSSNGAAVTREQVMQAMTSYVNGAYANQTLPIQGQDIYNPDPRAIVNHDMHTAQAGYGGDTNGPMMSQAPQMEGSTGYLHAINGTHLKGQAFQGPVVYDRADSGTIPPQASPVDATFTQGPLLGSYLSNDASSAGISVPIPQLTDPGHPAHHHQAFNGPGDPFWVEFVVTLEDVCNNHQNELTAGLLHPCTTGFTGHSLMITAPCAGHLSRTGEFRSPILAMPIEEQNRYILQHNTTFDGEVTALGATQMVMNDPRILIMTREHLLELRDTLGEMSRCYGFGAVLEDIEVIEALEEANTSWIAKFTTG